MLGYSLAQLMTIRASAICLLFSLCLSFLSQALAQTLDPEASAWLQAHPRLQLAPNPDFAPLDFIDARGRHRGLSADLAQLLAQRARLNFQVVRPGDAETALAAVEAGKADLASGVFKSRARAERMLFSNAYLRLPSALIARRDGTGVNALEALRGKRIAIVSGHVWQELLTDAGFTAELQAQLTMQDALKAVADGTADAYVGDLLTAEASMRRAGLADVLAVSGPSGLEAEMAFAVRKDAPQLKRVLDLALSGISATEEAALRARWENAEAQAELEVAPAEQVSPSRMPEVHALRVEVERANDLSSIEREALSQSLDEATRLDRSAEEALARLQRLTDEAEQAQLDASQASDTLQASAAEELLRWRGSLPQRATLGELEALLSTEQAARLSLQETYARLTAQASELQQRPAALSLELPELASRITALQVPEASVELGRRVAREVKLAELRELHAKSAAVRVEQRSLDGLLQGLAARRSERQVAVSLREQRIQILQELIAERSDSELTGELTLLAASARSYAKAIPALREVSAQNLATGETLVEHARRLMQLREQTQRIESKLAEISAALENSRARIAIGGVTESVGMILLAERRKLAGSAGLRAQLNELQREASDLQLAQIGLGEQRDSLTDVASALSRRLESEPEVAVTPEQRAQLTDLLLVRSQLLPRLAQQQQRVIDLLADAEAKLRKLLDQSSELSALMDQNLLWIPSHRPVTSAWIAQSSEAWRDLLKPSRWQEALSRMSERLQQTPWWSLVLLVPVLIAFGAKRIDRELGEIAGRLRQVRVDRYRYTLYALILSSARAAPMTLILLGLGEWLQAVGDGGRFTHSLGRALHAAAPYLYFFTLLLTMVKNDGVAHAHLRWSRDRRAALRALRPVLYFVLLPLLLLVALSNARDLDAQTDTVLRVVLVATNLLMAWIAWWLLQRNRLMASRSAGTDPRPATRRTLRLGLSSAFVVLALMPLVGYVFTSDVLLKVALRSYQVLFAVALVHGLVVRWLVLGERRIALARQQQGEAENLRQSTDPGLDAPSANPESIDLRAINAQSRTLLRALTVLFLVSGLLWSLSEVAPAFSLLERVVLWQSKELVDGVSVARSTSLGSVVLALVTLVVGITAVRNFPGLLEILLLRRFTDDASVRYAVVALSRYLIFFVVVVMVLGFLGVRWGHLQWLAAAFSVGLGFGLQEIFGNFAAGLILLFERPFRVGDLVTIGDLSGTVRRIRTRATTILDFDNKEIVVPNKTFITERFVNWTLTDTITRIVIKIGVTYEADPLKVNRTLLELARAHPAILDDPEPAALLLSVGEGSQNFELRCFVREISDRLRATDELYTSIMGTFKARGFVVASPQMDIHLQKKLLSEPVSVRS